MRRVSHAGRAGLTSARGRRIGDAAPPTPRQAERTRVGRHGRLFVERRRAGSVDRTRALNARHLRGGSEPRRGGGGVAMSGWGWDADSGAGTGGSGKDGEGRGTELLG